jgi:hypothetical protein
VNVEAVLGQVRLIRTAAERVLGAAERIADEVDQPEEVPWIDRVEEMPVNRAPDHPDLVKRKWTWWRTREPGQITGVTIHHTMSHSPLALARYMVRPVAEGGKGLPTVQYAYWVSAGDGCPVYKLALEEWAIWHDHTGANPTTISIGLAGSCHLKRPPNEQLETAAEFVRFLMGYHQFEVGQVQGHDQRAKEAANVITVCPGWLDEGIAKPSGRWREAFYEALESGY